MLTFKQNAGFTFIELLASIFIIALISGIFLTNYHAGNRQSRLINAAQKLASDMRLAQNYALGLREFEGGFPPGGWGVHFEQGNSNYIIFADGDNDQIYDSGEEFLTINLPDNITINSVAANPLDIVFLPPDPTIYFNAVNASVDVSTDIVLKDSQTGLTKTVKVNFLGLVDVII